MGSALETSLRTFRESRQGHNITQARAEDAVDGPKTPKRANESRRN